VQVLVLHQWQGGGIAFLNKKTKGLAACHAFSGLMRGKRRARRPFSFFFPHLSRAAGGGGGAPGGRG
jgi:hypothetical protein